MAKGKGAGGYDGRANLIPMNRRTEIEQKRIATMGGKASGAARRKKADFKKVLNQILTMKVPDDVMRQQLEALGLDPDMQTALNAAMVREALAGSVKAAEYVAKYSGQSAQTERDDRQQDAQTDRMKAAADLDRAKTEALKKQTIKAEEAEAEDDDSTEDTFLAALMGTASEDWEGTEDEKES
ncbi:MAG: hypothetical protein IJ126_08265 [Lachnospiraceae bacterium]|nr:hypothetical protein [Lachnospiraceae bacterium]